jgi:YjbE family integral membrane protein
MNLAPAFAAFVQVLIIDLSLAGDNAIVIGMAARGLPHAQRRRAMLIGLGAATVLRIVLAIFAVRLLRITGLALAGGLLLLWVCWKMYRDLTLAATRLQRQLDPKGESGQSKARTLRAAIMQILVADVGMSLDNILAVAGAARDHVFVLATGLIISVALMGVAAGASARLLHRWPWMSWAGMAVVLFVALRMIADGLQQLNLLH